MQQQRNRASHLHISPRTVKQHLRILFPHAGIKEGYLRTAFDKLGVWTRLELALYGPATVGRTAICTWAMGCCPRGQDRAWTRHINFRAAQQSKKSPPQAEGSCKGSRDASVERRASRPSCRAGRPGVPPAISPPSLDLSIRDDPSAEPLTATDHA